MKDIMDPLPANSPVEKESFANRKLIRPTLPRPENNGNHGSHGGHNPGPTAVPRPERVERHERMERNNERGHDRNNHERNNDRHAERSNNDRFGGGGRKQSPPEQTNAENFYYQKQMQSRTPMVIVLRDGEEVHGVIEWYDRDCLKVNRASGEPNLMIYKPAIKYMYKEGEGV
jgi:sRNA-binding regulator protein Hfq